MRSADKRGSVVIYVLFLITVMTAVLIKYSKEIKLKAMVSDNQYTKEIRIYELKNLASIIGSSYITGEDPSVKNLGEKRGEVVYNNNSYDVFVLKESDLEDINTKDRAKLVEVLYKIFGDASTEKVDKLADSILDFTDRDDLVREKGGEKDSYSFEGLPFNKNFSFPEEVKLVKHVGESDFFFEKVDNETVYDGIVARFTVWKNTAAVYNPLRGKYDVYKDSVRVYIKTPAGAVYLFFVGSRGGFTGTFYWLRLI